MQNEEEQKETSIKGDAKSRIKSEDARPLRQFSGHSRNGLFGLFRGARSLWIRRDGFGLTTLWGGLLQVYEGVEETRYGDGSRDTNNRCECKHQTNHDAGEIAGENSVNNYEDMLIAKFTEAQQNTSWEQPNEYVEVSEKRWPGRWLMFADGGDNRNVPVGKGVIN